MPLTSVSVATSGWPAIAQTKWTAWRRKLALTDICLESVDDQLDDVIEFVDPVFTGTVGDDDTWDPATQRWPKRADSHPYWEPLAGRGAWNSQAAAGSDGHPRQSKVAASAALRDAVQKLLTDQWSPRQISYQLSVDYSVQPAMNVVYESIQHALYSPQNHGLTQEMNRHLPTPMNELTFDQVLLRWLESAVSRVRPPTQ